MSNADEISLSGINCTTKTEHLEDGVISTRLTSRYEVAAQERLGSPPLHTPSWNSIYTSYSQLIPLSNGNL